mgnify:CR=1 FL=1
MGFGYGVLDQSDGFFEGESLNLLLNSPASESSDFNLDFSYLNLLSIFVSFVFSLFTIKYFLKYINKFSLKIFVYYRIFLGLVLLILAYL